MPIPCPCCKASNDTGPSCRRCKADLSLLLAIEAERSELLEAARQTLGSTRACDDEAPTEPNDNGSARASPSQFGNLPDTLSFGGGRLLPSQRSSWPLTFWFGRSLPIPNRRLARMIHQPPGAAS